MVQGKAAAGQSSSRAKQQQGKAAAGQSSSRAKQQQGKAAGINRLL
jgi:hypothetical protein